MSTRAARKTKCRTCKKATLTGDSADVMAFAVEVDPDPIGPLGEALAQLAGRATYAVRRQAGAAVRLHQRDRWQITGTTSLLPFDVVADHACGKPLPGVPSQFLSPTPQGATDDHPPF